ncbi:MAG: ParB/RepB/Spo0J family partition protein [Candidatus Omnitrophica bacterium]|nr:ParB/RepB/Spo0J family partition protein [Candidatus Omnitrophota bacterium]
MTNKRLGRGLAELISTLPQEESNYVILRTDQIRANRMQPRAAISDESLEELKASIQKSGVIEPLIVRPIAHGTYELVAGERRFRASQAIGIKEVPVIIKTLDDKEALEISLIENVQRQNLNPIEEAVGYSRLIEEYHYSQEDVAKAVGKDRATISNLIRLLSLPEEIKGAVRSGAISMGHAKVLLSVGEGTARMALFRRIQEDKLSVRQLEENAAGLLAPAKRRQKPSLDAQLRTIEEALRKILGTKVSLRARRKGGRILIDYFSAEDLNRILPLLGVR